MKTNLWALFLLSGLSTLFAAGAWSAEIGQSHTGNENMTVASIRPAPGTSLVDLPALAKIPFTEALKIALRAMPGKVLKAELEVENGNLMYSFTIVTRQKTVMEVEIDAGDGKVLAVDHD